ncbi:MAG: tetratricopeptide repeat protein [Candidatus Muirbacterium halophilum]|nr:tetratricopeptide repeat protein [Candidatus Muirbacterium halophilum]
MSKNYIFIVLFILISFTVISLENMPFKVENWYYNAKWLLENKKFDKAIESIDKAIEKMPSNTDLRDFKDIILEKQKDAFKIDYKYIIKKRLINIKPIEERVHTFGYPVYVIRTDEKKLLALAQYYVDADNISKAIEYAEKSLKLNSNFSQAYFFLGKIEMFDNPELALTYFKKSFYISQNPEYILYMSYTACYLKKKDYITTLVRLFDDKFDNTDIGAFIRIIDEKNLLDIEFAKEFEKQKVDRLEYLDMPSELSIFFYNRKFIIDNLLKILYPFFEKDWFFNYFSGYLYGEFLDIDQAFSYYSKAYEYAPKMHKENIKFLVEKFRDRSKIVLDPDSFEALWMKANNFYRNQNYAKSIEQARKALIKTEKKEEIYMLLGFNHFKRGEFSDARKYLDMAVEKIKDNAEIYFTYGEIYFLERNYYEALKNYEQALVLEPDNKTVLYKMGNIYSEQSEYEKSEAKMKQVLNIDADFIEAYIVLGNLYTKTNRFDEAITNFNNVLSRDEKFIDAYISLSIAYFKKWEISSESRMIDSAIQILERAKELAPDNDMVTQYVEYYYQQKAGG